jgi:hypothetical protein
MPCKFILHEPRISPQEKTWPDYCCFTIRSHDVREVIMLKPWKIVAVSTPGLILWASIGFGNGKIMD